MSNNDLTLLSTHHADTVFGGLGLTFCSHCLGKDPEALRAEKWVSTGIFQ